MAEIKTERLLLVPFSDDYLDEVARIFADPVVVRYISRGQPLSRDLIRKEWSDRNRRNWDEHGYGLWDMIDRRSGRWVGFSGLSLLEDWPGQTKWEVGWSVDPAFWGQGFATEAGKAGIQFGFEEAKLERIISVTIPENAPSRRVMEKCGLTCQGLLPWRGADCIWYAIDRADWGPPTLPD